MDKESLSIKELLEKQEELRVRKAQLETTLEKDSSNFTLGRYERLKIRIIELDTKIQIQKDKKLQALYLDFLESAGNTNTDKRLDFLRR